MRVSDDDSDYNRRGGNSGGRGTYEHHRGGGGQRMTDAERDRELRMRSEALGRDQERMLREEDREREAAQRREIRDREWELERERERLRERERQFAARRDSGVDVGGVGGDGGRFRESHPFAPRPGLRRAGTVPAPTMEDQGFIQVR
jgi:hypothetical protein